MQVYSIYHFFADLIHNKETIATAAKIQPEQFDVRLFSSYNRRGKFPDIVIRLNSDNPDMDGGELIELKDSDSYSVGSFNSSIPTGKKDLTKILSPHSRVWQEMHRLGEDIESHPIRNVFYLIRGKYEGKVKVCLVHGGFFETLSPTELIKSGLQQVLNEVLPTGFDDEIKSTLLEILSEQENFSQTRHVEGASVSIRLDVMTEANAAGNILQYPEIQDNTLNFVVPSSTPEQGEIEWNRLRQALAPGELEQVSIKRFKHLLNGDFQVFQIPL